MRHVTHHYKKIKKEPSVINMLALCVGVLQPLMTIPQIVTILQQQDASQISFWTWFTYDIASIVLLTYGIKHKLLPIIVAQILWLLVQTAIIILIFVY